MIGSLTTHVLDTARGCPAIDVVIELWLLEPQSDDGRTLLKTTRTNAGGRTDEPLLVGSDLKVGTYELVFAVGDYFARQGLATDTPPFLNRVPVRFGIADPSAHYHVPLLVSAWSYTTYRGS